MRRVSDTGGVLLRRVRDVLTAAGLDIAADDPAAPGLCLAATATGVTITWHPVAHVAAPIQDQPDPAPGSPSFRGLRDALRMAVTETLTAAGLDVANDPVTGTLTVTSGADGAESTSSERYH